MEGSVNQKNDAHFLEVVAALSIIDFAKTESSNLNNYEGKAENPIKSRIVAKAFLR